MSDPLHEPLARRLDTGRFFVGERKVRLGDVDRNGRLRLDALTRYTQDVSDDDTTDAGLDPWPGWVVRTTVVDEIAPAVLAEQLEFVTFCSGFGGRWAERRLSVSGDGGARYEVATLWVCIDPDSGRPQPLTDQFLALYGEAAGNRRIKARQLLPRPGQSRPVTDQVGSPDELGPPAAIHRWQVRAADFDAFGHVNNAAYWAVVEELAAPWTEPRRARIEYGPGLSSPGTVAIRTEADGEAGLLLWWSGLGPDPVADADREPAATEAPLASAMVAPLGTDR